MPNSMTYAQRLALPANTPPGTEVTLTDCFVVSGAGTSIVNGFYSPNGSANGKTFYGIDGLTNTAVWGQVEEGVFAWIITASDGNSYYNCLDDVEFPWLGTNYVAIGFGEIPVPTLTNPVTQRLNAPSDAPGGYFVQGGSQDGIYTFRNPQAGRVFSVMLGAIDEQDGGSVGWDSGENKWFVSLPNNLGGDFLYYSLSNVTTPDLATNWLNASDDSPASITVTSITEGQLVAAIDLINAGTTDANKTYFVSSPEGARNAYVAGTSKVSHNGTSQWMATDTGNIFNYSGGSTAAFPFGLFLSSVDIGDQPGPDVVRNDVAPDANWSTESTVPVAFIPDQPFGFGFNF